MSVIGNSPGVASQRVVSPFTATSGQTTFTPISGYTLGYCDVFLNGIKLANGDDYTAADGATVVLAVGAALGDFVEVVAYFPRGLSDGYLKSEADARFPRVDTASQGLSGTAKTNAKTNLDLNNVENKSSSTIRGELTSSNVTSALGYTPVNKAGDSVTGNFNLQGGALQFNANTSQYPISTTFNDNGTTSNQVNIVTVEKWIYTYAFEAYIGTGGTSNKYWYLHIPVGSNWVAAYTIELMAGGWSWGQASIDAKWVVQVVAGTTTVTAVHTVGATNFTCSGKAYNPNAGSNMYQRIALYCNQGSNGIFVRVRATTPLDYYSGFYHGVTPSNPTA